MKVQHGLNFEYLCLTLALLTGNSCCQNPPASSLLRQPFVATRTSNYSPKKTWQIARIDHYRHEGNYVPRYTHRQAVTVPTTEAPTTSTTAQAYNFRLVHAEPHTRSCTSTSHKCITSNSKTNVNANTTNNKSIAQTRRRKQQLNDDSVNVPRPAAAFGETQHFHDIFMRYGGPEDVSVGHVERRPELRAKRFEYLGKGNRHRGEMIWSDNKGAYGEHRWDMAQGKL